MKILGNFIKWFLYITVGILIVCGISCSIEGKEMVTVDISLISNRLMILIRCCRKNMERKNCKIYGKVYSLERWKMLLGVFFVGCSHVWQMI